MTIRIIGIGSPFGDDAAGLEAARILALSPPLDCEIIAADRPGADLIELLRGADAALLIDAVRSGSPAGTLHELSFTELGCAAGWVSSHGLGVAAAVQLARQLGQAPAQGWVLGIEITPMPRRRLLSLSRTARLAADRAAARARSWVREMRAPGTPPDCPASRRAV